MYKRQKQSIAADTGLSVATCNTLLNELERSGEVYSQKYQLNGVGRSTSVYQINEDYESILCCLLYTSSINALQDQASYLFRRDALLTIRENLSALPRSCLKKSTLMVRRASRRKRLSLIHI